MKVKFDFSTSPIHKCKCVRGSFGSLLCVWAVTGVSIPIIGSRWHHHFCDSLHGQDNCSFEFLFQTSLSFKGGFVTLSSKEKKRSKGRREEEKQLLLFHRGLRQYIINLSSPVESEGTRCWITCWRCYLSFHRQGLSDMMMVQFQQDGYAWNG